MSLGTAPDLCLSGFVVAVDRMRGVILRACPFDRLRASSELTEGADAVRPEESACTSSFHSKGKTGIGVFWVEMLT